MDIDKDKVKKYLFEERLHIETEGEKGNITLKCPSCGMINFVHAGGICELENWKKISFQSKNTKI